MRRATCVSFFLLVFVVALAQGQSSIYVSETDGNDVPSCGAIKKPCKTFAFSLTRVAARGRIIVLNSGEYGPVQITKSVTIEAPPGVDAMIDHPMTTPAAGRVGVEIAGGVDDNVTLRGLKIVMSGSGERGILFSSGAALHVENCRVHASLENIDIFPFGFTGEVRVFISDTVVTGFWGPSIGSTDVGIRVFRNTAPLVRVQIEHCTMEGNGNGLMVGDGASVTARGCVMARNRFAGVSVGGVTGTGTVRHSELTLENDLISGNGRGLTAVNTDVTVRVSHCTITDNDLGIDPFLTPSVQYLSRGNNTLEANGVDGTFTGVYTAK